MTFMVNPFVLFPVIGGGIPNDYIARYIFDGNYNDENGTYNATNSGSTFVGAGSGPNGTNAGIETGNGARVELGPSLATALGGASGTISVAVKPISASRGFIITCADNDLNNSFLIFEAQPTVTPQANHQLAGSEAYVVESDTDLTSSAWNHLIIRVNGSSTSFRVNGTNASKTILSGTDSGRFFNDITSKDHLTIGQLRRASPINGGAIQVAYMTLYDRELSDAECESLESEY